MGLCEIPEPSQELVQKYNDLKTLFYKRILRLYERIQGKTGPLVERLGQSEHGQAAAAFTGNSEVQRAYKAGVQLGT